MAKDKAIEALSETRSPESTGIGDNLATPLKTHARPISLLIVCGTVLVAAIAIATAMLVSNFRDRALGDSERELRNITLILAEQADRAFQALELVQISLIDRMQALGIDSGEDYERQMSGHDVHLFLKEKISGLPHVDAVTMINAQGKLINFSRYWPIPSVNVADRDYFKALKSDPSLTSFVSEPVRNRGTGTWTIYLARRFAGPNGEFLGLVLGAMELQYFEKFFGTIALEPTSSIALFRRDGMLLARYPHVDSLIGRSFGANALFVKLVEHSTHGVGRQTGVLDGEERLIAAHAVAHYPIVVTATTTVAAALSNWKKEAKFLIGAGALAVFVIAAVVFLIARKLLQRQKQSQRALSEQKLQLDAALNNMRHGLLMFDSEGLLVLHNQRFLQIYHLSPEAVKPGCSLSDLLRLRKAVGTFKGDPEQYVAKLVAVDGTFKGDPDRQIAKIFEEGKVETKVMELPDGRTISITNQSMPAGGWVSTHEDITERRRAEQERDRNREFLDQIIDNIPVSIIVKDAGERRIALINRATEELWGLSRTQVLGKTVYDLFPKENADLITAHDEKLLQSDSALFFDEHQNSAHPDDGRILTSRRHCIRGGDEKPNYLVSVIEDVTKRKKVEQQLQQAQKMEAVGNLTGGMAHDFNNLLTIIIGNLDLLQDDIASDHAAKQKVETVLQASERGADLTRQMLAFSRRQPLSPKPIDVNGLIHNTTRLLTRTLGENIAIELRIGADVWTALVDGSQLEAALVNIAINARDAMPGGGTLTIETRNTELDADYTARHAGIAPGEYVTIEITDTGTGMPPEILNRIFEPFFTTKPVGTGTGLGLSMVYGFMKQSGGHINAYSEVGKGTTFKLYLPVAPPSEIELDRSERAPKRPTRSATGGVILAVDDNAGVRATVVNQLRELGYQVREADNAHAALEILDSTEKIDLLFTDVVMPGGVNGKELATKARAKRSNLKVLFTSGFPGTSLINGTELDVGDALLSKPYRKYDLAKAVHEMLEQP